MYILSNILVQIVGIAVAISVHEFGHAYSAHLLGDDTAKMYGRMTLNPAKHLDIMGEITSAIIIYNVSFAAFNLLPIQPLDGWGVISSFIPYKYNEIAYKYESMSSIIFLVLIITGAYSIFISPIINVIWDILYLFM